MCTCLEDGHVGGGEVADVAEVPLHAGELQLHDPGERRGVALLDGGLHAVVGVCGDVVDRGGQVEQVHGHQPEGRLLRRHLV